MTDTTTYKESEIGLIPDDWDIVSIGSEFNIQQGKQVSARHRAGDNQKPFLRTANLFWNRIDLTVLDRMHFSAAEELRMKLHVNDVLVCEGGDVGRTALVSTELNGIYYQNHLHRLRAKNESINPLFFVYWMMYCLRFTEYYNGAGNKTTIPNLSQSRLKALLFPKPEKEEQNFITEIISLIQSAIQKQEQIISTIIELKNALMKKLFTEGMNNEPLKETEIGFIPESWEVVKIGAVADVLSGGTPSREEVFYWFNGTIPWVKTGEISYNLITNTDEKITELGYKNSSARLCKNGTLLMAMYGQGVTRGRVAILGIDATINQACAAIIPKSSSNIRTKFLYYFLENNYETIRTLGHGANQRNLSGALIKLIQIPIPKNISDQDEIILAMESIGKKLNLHKRKKQSLKSLFQSLLHHLMTGKTRMKDLSFEKEYKIEEDKLSMAAEP